jgi:hypothetical protein
VVVGWQKAVPEKGLAMTEVEELLMRIRGLVFAQAILKERGATTSELREHRLETERLRRRLARVVADGADRLEAA